MCNPFDDIAGFGEVLAERAVLLRGRALSHEKDILTALQAITGQAPFRNMTIPGGFLMSESRTNCGANGWISDRTGCRYTRIDPRSGLPWPALPQCFFDVAVAAAAEAGFVDFAPNACVIRRYEPGARLSSRQDENGCDFSKPIVTVSLGLPATLQFGGLRRSYPVRRFTLCHGDIVVWGGLSRLFYHGVTGLEDGQCERLGGMRISLTLRESPN
jgi:alkylated DNA repair protein (DNA oxidative demethylase)